ncbi:hypothetical protein CKO20_10365 [Rhodocyclus tenuis]|nr:hypothetical protein [Rhodocyclus tenuis]
MSVLAMSSLPAFAETPQQLLAGYVAEAAQATPGFSPSAERGRQFYLQRHAVTDRQQGCFSCHTDNPLAPGQHVTTSKSIEPLAPVAGSERFTRAAKSEKWFRRNCKEVIGRECSAGEKADLLHFLLAEAAR